MTMTLASPTLPRYVTLWNDTRRKTDLFVVAIDPRRTKRTVFTAPPLKTTFVPPFFWQYGCPNSPANNYPPLNLDELGDPSQFLSFSFNRGLSALTIGGTWDDVTSSSTNAPTTFAVAQANNGYSMAWATLDVEATIQSQNASNGPYYAYAGNFTSDQDENGASSTAFTWLPPYVYNDETNEYDAVSDPAVYYFLKGDQSGVIWLFSLNVATKEVTQVNSNLESLDGNGISDISYVPQVGAFVAMTFSGALLTYNVVFDPNDVTQVPTISLIGQNLEFEFNGSGGPQQAHLPRSINALYDSSGFAYFYVCGLYANNNNGDLTILRVLLNGINSDLPLQLVTTIPTGSCTQTVFTVYGLYFTTNGNAVGFLPWDSEQNGGLGNSPSLVYNAGDDIVTAIAFSPNSNDVVRVANPQTGQVSSYYNGGALFVAVTPTTNGDVSAKSASSVYMHDPCSGDTSLWIDQLIQGPTNAMLADVNMNVMVQNGDNGLSTLSVSYLPGIATMAAWILNDAYSCSSSGPKWLADLALGLAVAGLAFGFVGLVPAIASTVAFQAATIGVGVAGVAVSADTVGR